MALCVVLVCVVRMFFALCACLVVLFEVAWVCCLFVCVCLCCCSHVVSLGCVDVFVVCVFVCFVCFLVVVFGVCVFLNVVKQCLDRCCYSLFNLSSVFMFFSFQHPCCVLLCVLFVCVFLCCVLCRLFYVKLVCVYCLFVCVLLR